MSRRIFKQEGGSVPSVCFPEVGVRPAPPSGGDDGPEAAAALAARAILEKAAAEAERIKAAALEEARAKAEKLYEEPLNEALQAACALKASLEKASETAAAEAARGLVRLAVKIAEKVIRRRLEGDADEVFLMISRAIQAVPKGRTLLIRVNARDYENIQKAGQAIPTAARLAGSLSLETSAEVEPGGCVVITEGGAVNANPSRQLELIEAVLLKETTGGH